MFARFEVRRLDLQTARKILGTAIGMCPKEKLFKGYIDLEFDVRLYCIRAYVQELKCDCSSENLIMSVSCTRNTSR